MSSTEGKNEVGTPDSRSPSPSGCSTGLSLVDLRGLCRKRKVLFTSAVDSGGTWHSFAEFNATAAEVPDGDGGTVAVRPKPGAGVPSIAIVGADPLFLCVAAHRFKVSFPGATVNTFNRSDTEMLLREGRDVLPPHNILIVVNNVSLACGKQTRSAESPMEQKCASIFMSERAHLSMNASCSNLAGRVKKEFTEFVRCRNGYPNRLCIAKYGPEACRQPRRDEEFFVFLTTGLITRT